jgi:hypothetical protein
MKNLMIGFFAILTVTAYAKNDVSPFECHDEALHITRSFDNGLRGDDDQEAFSIDYKSQKSKTARIQVSLGDNLQRSYEVTFEKFRKEGSGNKGNIPQQVACFAKSVTRLH